MRPIRTVESNFTMLGFEPSIADLPGRIDIEEGVYTGVFALTDDERAAIVAGGQIELRICSLPIPPVSVNVVQLEEAEGEMRDGVPVEPDYRCRSCLALYVSKRAIALGLKCGQCGDDLRLPGAAD